MKVTIWKVLGDTLCQPTVRLGMGGLQQVSGMNDLRGDRMLPHSPDFPHLVPCPRGHDRIPPPKSRVDCLLLPEQKEPKNSQVESTSGSETAKCPGPLRCTWCVAVSSRSREAGRLHLSAGPCTREEPRGLRPPERHGDCQPLPCTWDEKGHERATGMRSDASMTVPGVLGFV